ncbi:hypothetical protein [Sphaerimonospora thailandensis]|uniref:Uncharacterized protein n=1 Tax=Sphaerimonospora thailandensis TaxID=795644 RepID=A0A8J3VZ00_9ACTN|nr:hypothetical protein [Sphaerimonospora thailandensis]GIH70022.1 hypothetical protein Mth01_22750 [Sphaerimonospora thailandensis]
MEAKVAGETRLAREIGRLRRPTTAAWAVNQLARRHPDDLAGLLEVGERLREAWRRQDADALAALGRRRTRITAGLIRVIRQDAEADGRPLPPAAVAEIERTLDAAVVDEEAAGEVRRGRLVRPLSYSGFAPAPVVRTTPRRNAPAPRPEAEKRRQEDKRRAAVRERERAERERRVGELRTVLAEAERTVAEAEQSHAARAAELAEAVRDRDRRAGKVAELTAELAEARERLTAAEHRVEVAEREEIVASEVSLSARHRADQARSALDQAAGQ